MKKNILPILISLLLVPSVFAQAQILDLNDTPNIITRINTLVNDLIPLLISLALVFFVYSLLRFILKAGEEKAEARDQMVFGIIILAVIIGVWGLVHFVLGAFGLTGQFAPDGIPKIK